MYDRRLIETKATKRGFSLYWHENSPNVWAVLCKTDFVCVGTWKETAAVDPNGDHEFRNTITGELRIISEAKIRNMYK